MNAGQRRIPLFPAGTATTVASIPIESSAYRYNTVYLTSVGTTSGGTITIEEANWDPLTGVPYGGTWSIIGTATNASALTGGATLAVRVPVGLYSYLRVRISGAITGGGTISAALVQGE
jgi:hypothetical protein